MTSNKDQKRLVRARMEKTGEAYTTARAAIAARRLKTEDAAAPVDTPSPYAAPRAGWPALAGKSDAVMREKTGRTWSEWVSVLDAEGAAGMSHTDIARKAVSLIEGGSGWWAQSVTVGYERIRGLREVGQRRTNGTFEAHRSRTFPVDVATLYAMFADARRRKRWLPEGVQRVRTATAPKSMRIDWKDGTQLHVNFMPKGESKSAVAVSQVKLSSKAELEAARVFWDERLGALREVLGSAG